MPFYTSPFGNGVLVGSGGNVTSNVHNFFGPRDAEGADGVLKVEGLTEQLILNIVAAEFLDGIDTLVPYSIPAGAIIKAAYVDIEEAFNLTGTSPTILVGTNTSEVTNGFVISETIAEGTTTANLTATLVGTWDNEVPLAVDTIVGIALGGTGGPAMARQGKARVTIVYDRANLSL